jgi:tetratricopeptide (TPR) repeat protein
VKAFVSGEAGTGVVMGSPPTVRSVYGGVAAPWHAADALRVFDGCSDVRAIEVATLDDLDRQCELAWAQDRGLRLFLFLLDPDEPEDELAEYAGCVSELLAEHPILVPLKRRLAASPLPDPDSERVRLACMHVGPVLDLFDWLLDVQEVVARVRAEFDSASFSEDASLLRERLTTDGSFLDVVTALMRGQDLTFTRLQVISRHRNASAAISQWFKALQGDLRRVPKADIRAQESDEVADWDRSESRHPSYAAYTNVRAQQRAIVAKLKDHDIGQARRLMTALVVSQRYNSTSDQLAKSLSNMARQAGNFDIPELALEWSREATEANPIDPMAYGHLANALIDIGSYDEAETALNEVESHGDPLFAATGRARILRSQGRLNEAREAFVAAGQTYKNHASLVHAMLGAAEALRELGDIPGALKEYQNLSISFPTEPGVWTGIASTLVDLGDMDEALRTYTKAATYDSLIAKIGRAHTFRTFGNLDNALRLFDEVLAEHPTNSFALCGRGDVLQDQGSFDLALAAYEKAMALSPYRSEPVLGKIHVLRHMERFQDALDLHEQFHGRFPYDKRFAAAPVVIYRAQGRFTNALVACDKLITRFPFDIHGRLSRAGILGRLGTLDEAMAAYDAILTERPRQRRAMLGKAAILIRTGRKDEAARLLPNEQPRSRGDWRTVTLRVTLLEDREGSPAAAEMLSRFISQCPFPVERRRMRDLLAIIELRRHRWQEVRRMVEAHPDEVSNVISLHVYAATHRTGKAREWLARILTHDGPADLISLADEIARRHQLTDEAPRQPAGWIEATEREILLADAA